MCAAAARGRWQILARRATLPKGLPHTPACVAELDELRPTKATAAKCSVDSRRHHSPSPQTSRGSMAFGTGWKRYGGCPWTEPVRKEKHNYALSQFEIFETWALLVVL